MKPIVQVLLSKLSLQDIARRGAEGRREREQEESAGEAVEVGFMSALSALNQYPIAVEHPVSQETSCKATRAIIEYIRQQYIREQPGKDSEEIIHELLKSFPYPSLQTPYTRTFLTDINNWIELEASDELFERARILLQDEDLTFKIAAATPKFRGLFGLTEHLARVVGPEIAMRRTPRLQRALQRTSHLELTRITSTEAEIRMTYYEAYRPTLHRDSCDFARGILSAVPQFAGSNQPAKLREIQCTLPIYRRGVIDDYFCLKDEQDNLWRFRWPFVESGDQIPLPVNSFQALGTNLTVDLLQLFQFSYSTLILARIPNLSC